MNLLYFLMIFVLFIFVCYFDGLKDGLMVLNGCWCFLKKLFLMRGNYGYGVENLEVMKVYCDVK